MVISHSTVAHSGAYCERFLAFFSPCKVYFNLDLLSYFTCLKEGQDIMEQSRIHLLIFSFSFKHCWENRYWNILVHTWQREKTLGIRAHDSITFRPLQWVYIYYVMEYFGQKADLRKSSYGIQRSSYGGWIEKPETMYDILRYDLSCAVSHFFHRNTIAF